MRLGCAVTMDRVKVVFGLVFLCVGNWVLAESVTTLVREYTYSASEHDSRVSARTAALQQLQTLVIEEVGIEIQSSFQQTTGTTNDEFNRKVQANYQSFAQAVTRTRILEERWDGQVFYIKVEISIDPQGIKEQLVTMPNLASCKENAEYLTNLYYQEDSEKRTEALFELSINAPFNDECFDRHRIVLKSLLNTQYPLEDVQEQRYNQHLYEQMLQQPMTQFGSYAPNYLRAIIGYLTYKGTLFDKQWKEILALIATAAPQYLDAYGEVLLIGYFQAFDHNEYYPRVSLETIFWRINYLEALTRASMTKSQYVESMYQLLLTLPEPEKSQAGFAYLIENYHHLENPSKVVDDAVWKLLNDPALETPTVKLVQLYLTRLEQSSDEQLIIPRGYDEKRISVVLDAIKKLDVSSKIRGQNIIQQLQESHGPLLVRMMALNGYDKKLDYQIILVRHHFPHTTICSPEQCAKRLFTDDKKQALAASQLLLAYGVDAADQRGLIVRKLERLFSYPHSLTHSDVKIRDHLLDLAPELTIDEQALRMLVKGFEQIDPELDQRLTTLLVSRYPESIAVIQAAYEDDFSIRTKIQLIKSFKTMPRNQKILSFLQNLKPQEGELRFAIDDALFAQQ